nr:MAG TPA: hypothetical protein [Caudoviricetes sp.]
MIQNRMFSMLVVFWIILKMMSQIRPSSLSKM